MADFFAKGNKPISGYGSPSPDFSTVAHKTGLKWIDGKDIWAKTGSYTFASTGRYTSEYLGAIDTVVEICGTIKYSDGAFGNIYRTDITGEQDILVINSTTTGEVICKNTFTTGTFYYTIYFTKP